MEETTESVNRMDLNPSVFGSSGSARSEHASTKALLKISQDMTRVLDQLTALRALIDCVRKHGVMVQVWKSLIKLSSGLRNYKELWMK